MKEVDDTEKHTGQITVWIGEFPEYEINYEVNTHVFNFDVKKHQAWSEGNEPIRSETDQFFRGFIKWDGCSHVWFGYEGDDTFADGYMHLCGKTDWIHLQELLGKVYALAAENIPHYDQKVAEEFPQNSELVYR